VHDAEQRDVGADSQRETENGDECEARRLEQLTRRAAEQGRHETGSDKPSYITERLRPPPPRDPGAVERRVDEQTSSHLPILFQKII
jgi:hypothetical protein